MQDPQELTATLEAKSFADYMAGFADGARFTAQAAKQAYLALKQSVRVSPEPPADQPKE